ncbi:MAG: alanine dehydrogenase [Capsulimonadales bacterium]|nr:alanine dehydrogenase [Capsulimonadales bacterium]
MRIGVPREIKEDEYRVGLLPSGVDALVSAGHSVLVETQAAAGIGFSDADYRAAGASIATSPEEVYARAEMVVKVKEPLAAEYGLLRPGQILFTYFHFAASEPLTRACLESGAICIAYETVELPDGSLPLLAPMSEVAGRMAVQEGAKYLERAMGGRGILLGGVPGVAPARVIILGGGMVGTESAKIAAGMGANVTIFDVSLPRLRYLDDVMPKNVTTLYSTRAAIREKALEADLLIGAVLLKGAKAPTLVPRSVIAQMKPGAVVVDVAVDQGGCIETTRPTTHKNPTYFVDGVLHYGVANMPGAVPFTSSFALTNATLPYVLALAAKGWKAALCQDGALLKGLNLADGKVTFKPLAEQYGAEYIAPDTLV